jgi:hypothetical protein
MSLVAGAVGAVGAAAGVYFAELVSDVTSDVVAAIGVGFCR